MTTIRLGYELNSWQAAGDRYVGQMPRIFAQISQAGFEGVEFDVVMLGEYYNDPESLGGVLDRNELSISAVAFSQPWQEAEENERERAAADRVFGFLRHFSGAQLVLVQEPVGEREGDVTQRQANAIACFHAVARRADEHGILTSVHPESSPGSLFRDEQDYRLLVKSLDPRVLGLALDTGHVSRVGIDVIELLNTFRPVVRHVHLRDVDADGNWCPLGQGIIDFEQIIRILQNSCYTGWVIAENDSDEAHKDPEEWVLRDGEFAEAVLEPLLSD